ncbi:metal-dependent hydrolase [Motilimonas pumila]|uniref:Metal-dependent hydrolase n=1 Tax=Motilimonas pumila TaxID=2303987 RepID=A0A418YBU7_9GAMM|nr:metal-dependent hydrolase [Motilimonas pumila]RJG41919.1 metal-dependent hydrolase [Motilimonas pumila]
MDSVTQIALGVSVASAIGFKAYGKKAILIGAALGTLPDLDVLINYGDAVANYTYHRGFSHSLFVLSALAIGLFILARSFVQTAKDNPWRTFLMIWLSLITHPLLDSFTTYGTQLFWPMPLMPTSWSSMFIIDPLYTLPLLISLLGLWLSKNSRRWQRINLAALTFSCLYLLASQGAKWQINQQLQAAQLTPSPVFISPMPFNIISWRILRYDGQQYSEALTYVGNKQPLKWQTHDTGRALLQQFQSPELARLEWFSNGFLSFQQQQGALHVTDLRLGMAGYFPFTFHIAQQQEGQWQAVDSVQLPQPKVEAARMKQLYRQVFSQHPDNLAQAER